MNAGLEAAVRLLNVTSAGLLAGSLGFGGAVLVPGSRQERPHRPSFRDNPTPEWVEYFNGIGPVALASSVLLAIASSGRPRAARVLDTISAAGLAGVVATTALITVPLNRRIESERPSDYPDEQSWSMAQNFNRAHSLRTALGIGAFICAAASSAMRR